MAPPRTRLLHQLLGTLRVAIMAEPSDWQDGELKVVVNHEEQYSVWPADRDLPLGWREAGKQGTKAECLA